MQDLTRRARDILRRNDRGGYTVPTAGLYPYQWNWDSCLVALGWASFDEGRAWQEIDTLFAAQWADGMVPHIVFHASDPGYFPGPDVWATGREPASSGITQPPVAASIVRRLLERAEASEAAESAARRLLPKLAASHRWWHSARDPGGGGLVATLHPWESGMDNSPAWDEALARVPVGELPPYQRRDTNHVDAAQRPTRDEYDRYLSLVLLFRELGYDPGRLYDASPYRVADVGSNAILLRADRDLAWLADTLGDRPLHDEAEGWVARGEQGFQRLWDEEAGLFLALDLTTERQIATATSAGFLGLYAGAADPAQAARLVAQFDRWRGDAAYGLPSVAVDDPLFDAGRYWRGPSWAIANHLIARGLDDYGHTARAAWLAADTARAIHHGGFHEYFHPLTGEGLGGDAFTWTAAMWLAWLDPDPAAETAIAMRDRLAGLYPAEQAAGAAAGLAALAASHRDRPVDHADRPRTIPQDAVLIAYGDQVSDDAGPPLDALRRWVEERLDGVLGSIHLLPIYPYSSDDGFSVIDYRSVDPALGDWNDVARLAERFSLMLDAVINHVSAQSDWFAAFCEGRAPYREFFLSYPPEDAPDVSGVTRPRTSPLLSRFETADGPRLVWTTFSDDQIDLDPANPDVLIELADLLLFYVERGARLIRLDAVSYLWKRLGSSCINLPETHECVRLLRDVLDAAAPETLIVTETNVPHGENVAYFGDGRNEAQMVYQFALPPLLLDAIYRGDARSLSDWAAGLSLPSGATAFFNITATHDGIGVRPVADILPPAQIDALVQGTLARGGQVSSRTLPDGGKAPYELNITFFDALLPPGADPAAPESLDRYIAAQAVALSLAGVPAIYFHNLFGTRNDTAGFAGTGRARTLNRRRFERAELDALLADGNGRERRIFDRYTALLRLWRTQPALHPAAPQRVLATNPAVFAVLRGEGTAEAVLALHNLSASPARVVLPQGLAAGPWVDLPTGDRFADGAAIELPPYRLLWLRRPWPV